MIPFIKSLKTLFASLLSRQPKTPLKKEPPKRSKEELLALLEKYKEAVRANPQDGMGHYNLGEVYMELLRFSESLSPMKEAIRINPKHRSAYYQLGNALVELGRDDEALEPLQEALRLDSKSMATRKRLAEAHTNLSVLYGKRKQQKESMRHFHEAIEILPDYAPAHLSLGICYTEMGKYQDALKKIKEALRLDKHLAVDAHFNFGIVYSKLGDRKEAIKHYQEAIKVSPKSALPNLNLGMLYAKSGKLEEAAQALSTATRLSPKMAREGFFKLGDVLLKLKRYQQAVKPLREAVKITPNNEKVRDSLAEALYQTSLSYHKSPEPDEEIEILKEAVEQNPEHVMAHYHLSQAYDKAGQGYYAIQHMLYAKQFLVEAHQDEWIAKALRAVKLLMQKYKYGEKDFVKLRVPRK